MSSEYTPKNNCNDLPAEDRSSVLLLGVTRIPNSPAAPRRPCSLPLSTTTTLTNPITPSSSSSSAHLRRSSFTSRRRSSSSTSVVKPIIAKSDDALVALKTPIMDRSVDSIGTCSLDVDASADLSADWSEASSGGTLRSLKTPSSSPHLPSYLALACTVNGYSTTTNYDPVRLARSRDTSPHRLDTSDTLTPKNSSYSIENNLLSPPNLVPLPIINKKATTMNEHTILHQRHEYYRSTTTKTFNNFTEKDTIDACYENGRKVTILSNGNNTTESKSFIQQRVERLYGPGALAQGFFVSKKQGVDKENTENGDVCMKQSTSSPALPVLRLLTPEFRAQLPSISPRKNGEVVMQKSCTLPEIKEVKETKVVVEAESVPVVLDETGEKDGHYFLKVLENETNRLLKMADKVEAELAENEGKLSEEIVGQIRSTSGKARLLVSQKMQQFRGLCTNNITQSGLEAFPTTNADLLGFWDMVMLQVHQVDALFKDIYDLKANNWEEIKRQPAVQLNGKGTRKVVQKVKLPATGANEELRKKREAQRKQMIEERRKAMKNNKQVENIEIFVPESS